MVSGHGHGHGHWSLVVGRWYLASYQLPTCISTCISTSLPTYVPTSLPPDLPIQLSSRSSFLEGKKNTHLEQSGMGVD